MAILKTRRQWRKQLQKVLPKQEPAGHYTLRYTVPTTAIVIAPDGSDSVVPSEEVVEHHIPLYREEQTRPYKRVGAQLLRDVYCKYFVDDARKDRYLWRENDQWYFCRANLDDKKIRNHIRGKEIYGVIGAKNTCFSAIDADYHGGDYDVFRDQLSAVVEALHGKDGWHYSFGPRGCHLLKTHAKTPVDVVRYDLKTLLHVIDAKHPELRERALAANMTPIADWEVYPDTKHGFRLPFAKGRTVFLDTPCEDLKHYVAWQRNPTYCSLEDTLKAIFDVIRPMPTTQNTKSNNKRHKKSTNPTDETRFGKLKGRYAQVLVDFWSGENNPPDSLNCAILLTARMMPFYHEDQQDAIDFIEGLVDNLPDVSFSDRLSTGKRKEISRIIGLAVKASYEKNSHQKDSVQSSKKLHRTFNAWQRRGFSLIDRSTWQKQRPCLGKRFSFSVVECQRLAILARILKANLQSTVDATRYLLRLLGNRKSCQMSIPFVREVLSGFGIRCRHSGKVNEYMKALRLFDWISLVGGCIPGRRGRLWEIGENMKAKFAEPTATPTPLFRRRHVSSSRRQKWNSCRPQSSFSHKKNSPVSIYCVPLPVSPSDREPRSHVSTTESAKHDTLHPP